jgi:hypothetical protein
MNRAGGRARNNLELVHESISASLWNQVSAGSGAPASFREGFSGSQLCDASGGRANGTKSGRRLAARD